MNLATIRTAIAAWVATATGIPAASVFWNGRPRGWTGPQYAVLRLSSTQEWGSDEVWWNYSIARPLGAELVPHQRGLRTLVCQVQIWSHNSTDALDALALCESVRDRIRLPATTDILSAAGLGFLRTEMLRDLSEIQDDREMSVAQIDVRLSATADTAGAAIGYVQQWDVTGTATTADGSTATIVDDLIP